MLKRQTSAIKTVTESLLSMSLESLRTHNSDHEQPWPQDDDVDDDYHDTTEPLRAAAADCALRRSDIKLPAAAAADRTTTSRQKLAARTPTPRPSVRQLRGSQGSGRVDVYDNNMSQHSLQLQPSHSRLEAKSRSRSGSRPDETVAAGELQFGGGTIRSHSSPSEHSFNGTYSDYYTAEQQQQQQQQQELVGGASRHVHVARKLPGDNIATGRERTVDVQYQQNNCDPASSTSQTSVVSCCHPRRQQNYRPLLPTASMSTLAADAPASRFNVRTTARRPVPVAPSGPAHHRRASRIPRPEPRAARPSASLASTCVSRWSSVSSLHSEFNYARPMPTERIPFSKFGLECVVPLARMEVSLTPVDAFSIVGGPGHRKRFLPQTENFPDDLWHSVESSLPPLSVVKAQNEHDTGECHVSIVSSIVARPVAHTSTQTHKSVSLTTNSSPRPARKRSSSARKVKVAANEGDDNADEGYSKLLVRLVKLLYLQAKLNASKSDRNNSSTSSKEPPPATKSQQANGQHQQQPPLLTHSTLLEHLQRLQHRSTTTAPAETTQAQAVNTNTKTAQPSHRPHHGGPKVYRMGSSVTPVHSKNYPATTRSAANVESNNRWSNAVRSKTPYFDHNSAAHQLEPTKSWTYPSPRSSTSFSPNFNQWHHYDNRYLRVSAYPGMRYGYSSYHRPSVSDYTVGHGSLLFDPTLPDPTHHIHSS